MKPEGLYAGNSEGLLVKSRVAFTPDPVDGGLDGKESQPFQVAIAPEWLKLLQSVFQIWQSLQPTSSYDISPDKTTVRTLKKKQVIPAFIAYIA